MGGHVRSVTTVPKVCSIRCRAQMAQPASKLMEQASTTVVRVLLERAARTEHILFLARPDSTALLVRALSLVRLGHSIRLMEEANSKTASCVTPVSCAIAPR